MNAPLEDALEALRIKACAWGWDGDSGLWCCCRQIGQMVSLCIQGLIDNFFLYNMKENVFFIIKQLNILSI